jgi:hypothetical protein
MPVKQESLNNQLEDELNKYSPVPMTSGGKEVDVADEADVFRFDFIKDGVNYGPVHVSIDGTSKMIIYYSKDVQDSPRGRSIEGSGEESFDDLCKRLYRWAVGHQLRPQKVYSSKLGKDMAKREHTKKMNEGYYPIGKKVSYSDNIAETKIIIQHSRALEEGEQRFRNIARIFVENSAGEKFLLDTKMPGLARVHARNIAEGHTPYDERGKHISSMIKEYNTMAGFCRATKNNTNESISHLVESGFQHYGHVRETLRKLSSKRGYKEYFESWTPTLNEEVVDSTTDLAEMFLNSSLDPRIENALPFLSKFAQPVMEMNEVVELEEWTNTIVDEALRPNTKPQIENLATLLSADNQIPFGPNALTIKSELAGLLDNDQLHSKLEQLSKDDPDADAKDSVLAWMELSRDPAMQEVVDMVKAGSQPAPAPAAPQQPMQEADVSEGPTSDMRDFFRNKPGTAPTPQVAARYRASEDMAEDADSTNVKSRQATLNTPAGDFTANITKNKSTNTVSGTMPVGGATLSATKDMTPGGAQTVSVDTNVVPNLNLSATRKSADYNKGQLAGTKSVSAKYTDTTGSLGEPGKQHTATRTSGVGFGGASGPRVGKNYVDQYSISESIDPLDAIKRLLGK